nr:MAG TPA: transposase [Caudoviricetes sp.]
MDENLKNKSNIPTWISIQEACQLLNLTEKTVKDYCRNGKINYKIELHNKSYKYLIHFESLPNFAKYKVVPQSSENKIKYSEAPDWAKVQAEKYIRIIQESEYLKGGKLKDFIIDWNIKNPQFKTSYPSVIRMRRRYNENGIIGLLSRYGNNAEKSTVNNLYFEYFKNLYLVEGAPSLRSCWDITRGYAIRQYGINNSEFPSYAAFKRKLKREIPEPSIYLARYGQTAWNKKYGNYIDRDYSNVVCGEVWVSDHAQIDVACLSPDGDVVFPWVTAWRDYKSGKWLGWLLQCGHPNSDHIFQSFYYAAEVFGLPKDVIIDNGKDYRSKDFAGGRQFKIETDEFKTTCMLSELKVKANFALPYNAQTKPIERDFLKVKELFSKHCVGYRGGNVVERPEKLAKEIKEGKIIPFEQFKKVFDDFIVNILNKRPSKGKNHNGLSPDQLFNVEFKEKIEVSNDALKLFCMRTSKNYTIKRNGIKDNKLGITYWADWLISKTGLKVYLRRDINNFKDAWVFNAENNEFIGKVTAVKAVAALHADEVSKDAFKEAMAIKKRSLKITKSYIKQTRDISIEEKCENYKAAYTSVEKECKPKISRIANTNMDKAIRKNKEMEAFGQYDLSIFLNEEKKEEKPLYLYETDKILAERAKGVANGY